MAKKTAKRGKPKRGPGRPKLTGDEASQLIALRCNVGFLARLDRWREKQEGKPDRSSAIRKCTEAALEADGF